MEVGSAGTSSPSHGPDGPERPVGLEDAEETGMALILRLPEEVVLMIFRALSPEDVACRAARVCRSWRRLARDPSLWAGTALRYSRNSQDDFIRVLKFAPELRCLDYSGYTCEFPANVARGILDGVKDVRELHFQTTNLVDKGLIASILLHFKEHLEKLTLFVNSNLVTCNLDPGTSSGPGQNESQRLEFLSAIGALEQLRTLVLKGAWRCHSTHASVGEGCPRLEALDISGLSTDFFDEHECPFFVTLLRNKRGTLRSLSLSGCYIHPSILSEVAQVSNLREITVTLATLHIIDKLDKLEKLHIRGHGRGDGLTIVGDISEFITTCSRFTTLKELVLEDVMDHGNRIAPAMAHSCASLESLTVAAGTILEPAGYSEVVRNLHSLRRLVVQGSVTLKLRHLQVVPRFLKRLNLLDVRGCFRECGIPPRVLARLRHPVRGLPGLRVLSDPFVRYEKRRQSITAADLSSTDEDMEDGI